MAEATGVATSGDTDLNTKMETLASGWRVPAWRGKSACSNTDPAKIFPEDGRPSKAATIACLNCPVKRECLESALESPWTPYGPWGGLPQGQVQALWLERHPADRNDETGVLAYLGSDMQARNDAAHSAGAKRRDRWSA